MASLQAELWPGMFCMFCILFCIFLRFASSLPLMGDPLPSRWAFGDTKEPDDFPLLANVKTMEDESMRFNTHGGADTRWRRSCWGSSTREMVLTQPPTTSRSSFYQTSRGGSSFQPKICFIWLVGVFLTWSDYHQPLTSSNLFLRILSRFFCITSCIVFSEKLSTISNQPNYLCGRWERLVSRHQSVLKRFPALQLQAHQSLGRNKNLNKLYGIFLDLKIIFTKDKVSASGATSIPRCNKKSDGSHDAHIPNWPLQQSLSGNVNML